MGTLGDTDELVETAARVSADEIAIERERRALLASLAPQPEGVRRPWVRPIGDYERRETTIVEGLRYG